MSPGGEACGRTGSPTAGTETSPYFRAAVQAGVKSLCLAHVIYPVLDGRPNAIATESRPILGDLRCGEMG